MRLNFGQRYSNIWCYGQSKLANVLHANELSRVLKEQGAIVTANSLHPGVIATNIFRYRKIIDGFVNYVGKHFMRSVQQGAATTCYVALHPGVRGIIGRYFTDSNIVELKGQAADQDMAKKLWDLCLKMADLARGLLVF